MSSLHSFRPRIEMSQATMLRVEVLYNRYCEVMRMEPFDHLIPGDVIKLRHTQSMSNISEVLRGVEAFANLAIAAHADGASVDLDGKNLRTFHHRVGDLLAQVDKLIELAERTHQ